ncbi:MAG: hypothetical protein ACE5EH_12855 [Gammaproteobacteria bacterium]
MANPPKMVYDDSGRLVEVILTAEDFIAYLRTIAERTDWESLPVALQDSIDRMLIDEVRDEKETAVDLLSALAEHDDDA